MTLSFGEATELSECTRLHFRCSGFVGLIRVDYTCGDTTDDPLSEGGRSLSGSAAEMTWIYCRCTKVWAHYNSHRAFLPAPPGRPPARLPPDIHRQIHRPGNSLFDAEPFIGSGQKGRALKGPQ